MKSPTHPSSSPIYRKDTRQDAGGSGGERMNKARDIGGAAKTKEQLASELAEAYRRIAELEASQAECKQAEESQRQALAEALQSMHALRESEERYRAFSDATTEALLLHKDGITIDVNRSFLNMYGYDNPSELIGKNSIELTIPTPEDRAKIHQKIKSGATGPYEVMARRANDGTTFPVEIYARQIHYKGEIVRVVLIMDITERKQAETERERLQQEIFEAQKRALQELSTPIIPVMEHIIIMPLIGSVDTMRARDITRTLLAGIRRHRAKAVILDITSVPMVDSEVADHLNKTIQAARLKGARTIITGISDAVAETIVDLGINWSGIETLRDLQTGLRVAMADVNQRDGR
jgi:rsbT co-antagonist protein RsbR